MIIYVGSEYGTDLNEMPQRIAPLGDLSYTTLDPATLLRSQKQKFNIKSNSMRIRTKLGGPKQSQH